MEHTYTCQDSFPHQNDRIQYVPYFQPTPEVVPSQMMFDPTKVPIFHGTVPYGANYSYPRHSCCNYMPFRNHYGYRPSCPHFFPPQPTPWWGSYPVYPQLFPALVPPPSAYAADIPTYEYDKDVAGPGSHHCCGCRNHVCKPKIEEQEPSLKKEKPSAGVVQSLPANFKNYQYPIIWIPPEYVKNKEQTMPLELKSVDPDSTSQYIKPQGRTSQQQSCWKNFFPVRMEDLGLQTHNGDDHRKGNQQPEDNKKQFSYPIIWMPYAGQPPAERVEKETSPKSSYQGSPSDSYVNSAKNYTANGKTEEPGEEGNVGGKNEFNMPEECDGNKNVPVKNFHQENAGKGTSVVSNKGVEDKVKGSSGIKEPVSPKEKKKLPPVCLRIDPLPRRKNTSGSSRSLSPSGARENALSGVKNINGSNPPAEAADEKRLNQEKRKEVKVVEVKDSPTGKKDGEMVHEQSVEHPVILNSLGQEERSDREVGKGIGEHETVTEDNIAGDEKMEERKETEDRNLSETKAATLLQAAYRGFEVRKWETRKKLKQMARIRDEVAKIKKNVQELESSTGASLDQEKVTKQRMVIGESIMSLLLSLDTIQGLHSSLRNVRKSLARELVTLQERLDVLVSKRSDDLTEKQSSASGDEYMHEVSADDTNKQHEECRKEDSQSVEAIYGQDESRAAQIKGFGGSSPNEKEDPQKADDIVGVDMTVSLHEEGELALPSTVTTMPIQVEGDSSQLINKEEEKQLQGEYFNADKMLPVNLPEERPPTLAIEKTAGPGKVKDESSFSEFLKAAPTEEEVFNKQIESNVVEQSIKQEQEIEEKHGISNSHEPERIVVEKVTENSVVSNAYEKDVVVVTEDKPALDGEVMSSSKSKLSDSKPNDGLESNENLLEENEKLREMMQKLMEAGKEQLDVISNLTGRVKDLERKLAKKKKMRSRRCKTVAATRPSLLKRVANSTQQAPHDLSM